LVSLFLLLGFSLISTKAVYKKKEAPLIDGQPLSLLGFLARESLSTQAKEEQKTGSNGPD
jgi:hypothetical protein